MRARCDESASESGIDSISIDIKIGIRWTLYENYNPKGNNKILYICHSPLDALQLL